MQYWDQRYLASPQRYDWYHRYWAIKPLLDRFDAREAPVLHVGVGLSELQDDMIRDGYKNIVNIDYSGVAIAHMQRLAKLHQAASQAGAQCSYEIGDVRHMPQYDDASFQLVVDKGTLDAMLCGPGSMESSCHMLQVCRRTTCMHMQRTDSEPWI